MSKGKVCNRDESRQEFKSLYYEKDTFNSKIEQLKQKSEVVCRGDEELQNAAQRNYEASFEIYVMQLEDHIYVCVCVCIHTYIHTQLELQKKKERACDGTIFENIMAVSFPN